MKIKQKKIKQYFFEYLNQIFSKKMVIQIGFPSILGYCNSALNPKLSFENNLNKFLRIVSILLLQELFRFGALLWNIKIFLSRNVPLI